MFNPGMFCDKEITLSINSKLPVIFKLNNQKKKENQITIQGSSKHLSLFFFVFDIYT